MINWDATSEDADLIRKIIDRAIGAGMCDKRNRLNLDMDLTATHLNGCPLNLVKLLAFEDFDFEHDLYGISQNINREIGKLERCFLPRCAVPSTPLGADEDWAGVGC